MKVVPPHRAYQEDHALVAQILGDLCRRAGQHGWSDGAERIRRAVREWKGLTPIGIEHLEQILTRGRLQWDDDVKPPTQFVFMKPVEREGWMVPLLAVSYDFSSAPPALRLRLALCALADGELVATGLRYETPSGPGTHAYCHAQLLSSFSKDSRNPALLDMGWLPDRQPALPLDAVNPVSLCASMLVSLYGPQEASGYLARLRGRHARERLTHMFCWHYVWIDEPDDGDHVAHLGEVSGTVVGGGLPDGVKRVALVIYRESTNCFWNGSDWVEGEVQAGHAEVTSEGKWTFRGPFPKWDAHEDCYLIEPRGCRDSGLPCCSQPIIAHVKGI